MYTLYLTWVAFQPKLCGPSWSSADYCVDRPTFLVGPYGPTWLLCMRWQIHCSIHCPCSVVPMVCSTAFVWADRSTVQSTVLVGSDGLPWLLFMHVDWQIYPLSLLVLTVCLTALYGLTDPLSCPVLFGPDCLTWVLSVWTDRYTVQSTALLGSDDLTWLLRCTGVWGWQIHCPVWSWLSDLTALCGLTDPLSSPLSWFVLMIWLDCSCMGLWFNISAAQCCWGLELNKHANHFSWKYNYMKIIHHTESYMWTARLKFRAAVNFNHQVYVHILGFFFHW